MSDTSGPTSGKPFAQYNPDTHSWKTSGGTEASGSTPYLRTWPKTGYMRDGLASTLPKSELPTSEKDSSSLRLLPTPKASDYKRGDGPGTNARKSPELPAVTSHFPLFDEWPCLEAVVNWMSVVGPPPPEDEGNKDRRRLNPEFPEWMMGLPRGYVTDPAIGLRRPDQLKMIGNGVCPQQAELAIKQLLDMK